MNKKGSVLMITLWILAILVIFALGLGHRATINLRLVKYQRDRLKATYLAKAGINRAIVELETDKNTYDSLNETWSTGSDSTGKSLFENVEIEEGLGETFTVKYLYDKDKNVYLCMADEERKININGIEPLGQKLLKEIFNFVDEFRGLRGIKDDAEGLKNAIVDYIDDNSDAMEGGSEDEIFKNKPLKIPEELLIILQYFYQEKPVEEYREKAQEIFNNIKDLITVWGDSVNINTVSEDVLTILARSVAVNDQEINIVSRVVDEILRIRDERTKKCFEDKTDIPNDIDRDTTDDDNLITRLKEKLILKSYFFKIVATGKVGNITKNITAIYDRGSKKIVYWHEN